MSLINLLSWDTPFELFAKLVTRALFYFFENFLQCVLALNLILPLIGIAIVSILAGLNPKNLQNFKLQHKVSLWFTGILFVLEKSVTGFQGAFIFSFWNINVLFGVDFISMSLIVLTNLFIYLCVLSLRSSDIYGKYTLYEILVLLLFIQWGLLCAFSVLDLLGFFIFFEATLVPIFLIILRGGSRERKARASFLIALYTLLGSIFMLFNIIYILNKFGSTNYIYLSGLAFSATDQKILWLTFFLAFAAKIPVFPFHIWLPEAHVESPTIGSVILAALLLKLGIYGLIRFGLPLFPYGQEYFKQIIATLTICSFTYTNFAAIRQVDIKKVIAYSSVVHMNLIVLGILCISVESLDGAIYQMIAHGIVSGALFFCIGIIYERYATRFIWYYGGVAFILPLYSIFFLIFTLANISFPKSSNFIGEMLLFLGIFRDNFLLGTIASLSMFWGAIYSVWTYNRVCFGNIKTFATKGLKFSDIDKQDFSILIFLVFFLMLTGIYSSSILDYISGNTTLIISKAQHEIDRVSNPGMVAAIPVWIPGQGYSI